MDCASPGASANALHLAEIRRGRVPPYGRTRQIVRIR